MATWCLTKQAEANLLEALRKEGSPQKMVDRTSEERVAFFAKFAGEENASQINALFESKLLLKNQVRGFKTFIKNIGGPKRVQLEFTDKVEKLDKAMTEAQLDQFVSDYVAKKLGLGVTEEEFATITKLSKELSGLKKSFNKESLKWESKADADKYGATKVAMENYVESLKNPNKSIVQIMKDRGYQFGEEAAKNPTRAVGTALLDVAKTIADNSVSLVASVDDSFVGRQGIFTLLSGHPLVWSKAFLSSLGDFAKTLGGQKATDALMAKVYSDPLFLNGEYKRAKIIDDNEEQFPTSLPERIPVVGRLFKASEVAFKNSSIRMRTEMYKILRKVVEDSGEEIDQEQIKGLGRVVNSLLARGDIGRAANPITRLLMWAPKMLKADIDLLTGHAFEDIPAASRKIAFGNLIKIIMATAAIEGIAYANDPKSTEVDPRSSDFLAIKSGDTRLKLLRGIPGAITLMSRLFTGQTKSATTGEIKDLGPKIGQQSRLDVALNYFIGKAPPATGALATLLRGKDYEGKPPTLSSIVLQAGVPISIQNLIDLAKDPTIDATFGAIADFFGFSSNTFRDSNVKSGIIPEGQKISNQDFMSLVSTYAEALGTDPETAFNRIFTGQRIRRVDNGAIIVERMSLEDSQAVKKASGANNPQVKLDHTVPLELGGSNGTDNLKLVTNGEWSSYTKVENALGKALKEKRISKSEAQKLIKEFKAISDGPKRKKFGDEIIQRLK